MRVFFLCACMMACACADVYGQGMKGAGAPGCAQASPQQCVEMALEAMGGRERLAALKSVRLHTAGHTLLMEQSYRQAPFITSYQRAEETIDLAGGRTMRQVRQTWPESDAKQEDSEVTLVTGPGGGVYHLKTGDSPCSAASLDAARESLALGPARLLLTAASAPDLHYETPETVRETEHAVVGFTWNHVPVRVLLNPFNHLPDAVETTEQFRDFWWFWGDVRQRVYYENWKLFAGIVYPTNRVTERNGTVWSSEQALEVEFDVPIDEKAFAVDAAMAKASLAQVGWNRAFHAGKETVLAEGIDLFPGSWNATIVKQADGIVILEAPISGLYLEGVMEEARKRYPGAPIKAVLSTSDSWPHVGGVRRAVAEGLPVYILDLNQPLLDRMMSAPHRVEPDALEKAGASKTPQWKIVSAHVEVGSGENRMELYPLRGALTERQYMVYFPAHRLLYASDTLAMHDDGSLYAPELMSEVEQAVKRENLLVEKVFAMHQGPMEWDKVVAMVEKARHG